MYFMMAKFLLQALLLASLGFISLSFVIKDHRWNYFVYSQWWPQSQCFYKDSKHVEPWGVNDYKFTNTCVPQGIDSWTIHGLWPTIDGKPEPLYCNSSLPFDESKIEDLKPKMMKQWLPFPKTSESSAIHLWSHEWTKHGTCAVTLPALDSEHKYFAYCLALNTKYNILEDLKRANVVPSNSHGYKVNDIANAITKIYGTKGRVVCLDGPDGDSYLAGIRICLDKKFQPQDCIVTEPEKCYGDDDVLYPIIVHPQKSVAN